MEPPFLSVAQRNRQENGGENAKGTFLNLVLALSGSKRGYRQPCINDSTPSKMPKHIGICILPLRR